MTDAIVVGSGPNGLAAAITLAQAGLSVTVLEAETEIGGGLRTAELTLPGFRHDVCSAVHPFAAASPFLRTLPLLEHGLQWIHPEAPLAHPLDGGHAAVLERDLHATAGALGEDRMAYLRLIGPLVRHSEALIEAVLAPLLPPRLLMARMAALFAQPAARLARSRFRTAAARALFAGSAAHSTSPLESFGTAAFGLALQLCGHSAGWPFPRGGAQSLADALASLLRSIGGRIETGFRVRALADVSGARLVLIDVTPRQLLAICGDALSHAYAKRLRQFRYGPAAYKVDWALDAPIPWKNPGVARAGTVHVGGTLEEIADAERAVSMGQHPERPFVLLGQPTLFDSTRAPAGKHIAWGYCHVPLGSEVSMLERIEAQVERFAPGFRERILARSVLAPRALEAHNANLVGGDIQGGSLDLRQLVFRPSWRTPLRNVFLCSSSTPPGPGVHGMCGHLAAREALRQLR